jgi:hypothetical protein
MSSSGIGGKVGMVWRGEGIESRQQTDFHVRACMDFLEQSRTCTTM